MLKYLKDHFNYIKNQYTENGIENVLWIINIIPKLAGFSLKKEKVRAITPYWAYHFSALTYVYAIGNAYYLMYEAKEVREYIKNFTNITILALIINLTFWWLNQRTLLKKVLEKIKWSDGIAKNNILRHEKHVKWIKIMKFLVIGYLAMNWISSIFIYLPARTSLDEGFCMTPCVGMDLTHSPNKEFCRIILFFMELSIMVVALSFQILFVFVIAHTACMYELLADDMLQLDTEVDNAEVKKKLPVIIQRHVMILATINDINRLYSIPIGTNFGSNALCISFFFYLTLEELLGFIPILLYCFVTFFLYCTLCQNMLNAADSFERSVYCCGWEKFNAEEQKSVYLMLLLAQRRVEILAADIVAVNICTFATTCQFMFKLVTVFKF